MRAGVAEIGDYIVWGLPDGQPYATYVVGPGYDLYLEREGWREERRASLRARLDRAVDEEKMPASLRDSMLERDGETAAHLVELSEDVTPDLDAWARRLALPVVVRYRPGEAQ